MEMTNSTSPVIRDGKRTILRLLGVVAALLGIPLWIGSLTPLSWSAPLLNTWHVLLTIGVVLLSLLLRMLWKIARTWRDWLLELPAMAAAVCFTVSFPFIVIGSVLIYDNPAAYVTMVIGSPDHAYVAELHYLGPGFGGGTRIHVTVSRSWLPGIVEDMGTYWSEYRNAEAQIAWRGNSVLEIKVDPKTLSVEPRILAWFPCDALNIILGALEAIFAPLWGPAHA